MGKKQTEMYTMPLQQANTTSPAFHPKAQRLLMVAFGRSSGSSAFQAYLPMVLTAPQWYVVA